MLCVIGLYYPVICISTDYERSIKIKVSKLLSINNYVFKKIKDKMLLRYHY